MPPIVGIIVSIAIAGITYGVQAALAPKIKSPQQSGRIDQLRSIAKSNTAPLRVIYGTYRASGVLLFARSVNAFGQQKSGGQFLHFALALAHGPITDIYDVQLNDEPANSTRFSNLAAFIPFMGAREQRMFLGPIQLGVDGTGTTCVLPEEWLEGHRPLRGVAYIWGLLKHNPAVFPGGAPNVRVTMKGRRVYDPREHLDEGGAQSPDNPDTHTWTNNWALCARDFLTNQEYGFGVPHSEVCDDCTMEAADVSDDEIDAPSDRVNGEDVPPKIKRYTCDGLFQTDEQPIDTFARILSAGAGSCLFYGGKWHLKAGAVEPVATDVTTSAEIHLTESDLRDDKDIQVTRLPGRKDRTNTVRGTFINPAKQYLPDNFTAVSDDFFLEQDGNVELSTELQLDFTQHKDRAEYIAGIFLRESRMTRFLFPAKPTAMQIVPKSVVKVTHEHFGWAAKKFRVADRIRNEDGSIDLLLEEYADSNYTQGIGARELPDPTNLPEPFLLLPPQNVTAVEQVHVNPDGARVAAVLVSWAEPAGGLVDGYQVQWIKLLGDNTTVQTRWVPSPALSTEITTLQAGTYTIAVRSTLNTQLSAPVVRQVTVTYRSLPPPDAINLRVRVTTDGTRILTWDVAGGVEPPDLVGYQWRWAAGSQPATIAAWDAATRGGQVASRTAETRTPVAPGTYTFFVRARDNDAILSNNPATVTVTIEPREQNIIVEREFGEERWPGEVIDGRINANGHIEGRGNATWSSGTFASVATWGSVGRPVTYLTEPIDLRGERSVRLKWDVRVRDDASYRIDVGFKHTSEEAFTTFHRRMGGQGAFLQLRIRVYPGASAPILERLHLTVQELLDEETREDLPMSGPSGSIWRIEDTQGDWDAGTWQVNVRSVPAPAPGQPNRARFEADPESSLEFDGSTNYASALDSPVLRLGTSGFTIEALTKFDDPSGDDCVLIGKGTDWRVGRLGTTIYLMVNNVVVAGSAMAISDVFPIYHWAYSYSGGRLVGMLNGEVVVRVTRNLNPPHSSAIVRIGADHTGAKKFDGIMEELRVWYYGRTESQIAAGANGQVDPRAPGLVGYWRASDATGTQLSDLTSFAGHASITGTPLWVRVAFRESPPIPMSLLPAFRVGRVLFSSDTPGSSTVTVQVSGDSGLNWSFVPGIVDVQKLPGRAYPNDTLRVRQYLKSTDPDVTPFIGTLVSILGYDRGLGDLIVQPRARFGSMLQAGITAIQDATRPAAWSLVAKDAAAVRFRVFNAEDGDPMDALADVRLRGAQLG